MTLKSETQNWKSHASDRRTVALRAAIGIRRFSVSRGLTLVELLVTIVILVTLLAAVLPAVSPNNEGRKIREAARQLTSLFAQAQAQAARDGRPVGVGFSDWIDANNDGILDPGEATGMALEAFIVAEPPVFNGFSTSSAVLIDQIPRTPPKYSNPPATSTPPGYGSNPPFNITFGENVGGESFVSDPNDPTQMLPADSFHVGDVVVVGQERFKIVADDLDDVDDQDSTPDVVNLNRNATDPESRQILKSQRVVAVVWLTRKDRTNDFLPIGGRAFSIRRQPAVGERPSRAAGQSVQFPKGVGIDLDPSDPDHTLSLVFSPNGSVDAIYQDGRKQSDRGPTYLLLGRTENANPAFPNPAFPNPGPPPAPPSLVDFTPYAFTTSDTKDTVAQRRREVNLLNAESRWIVITAAGRILAAQNYVFDPLLKTASGKYAYIDGLDPNATNAPAEQRDRQREGVDDKSVTPTFHYPGAREYAENLIGETGG